MSRCVRQESAAVLFGVFGWDAQAKLTERMGREGKMPGATESAAVGTPSASDWIGWLASYVRAADSDLSSSPYRIDPITGSIFLEDQVLWESKECGSSLPAADWHLTRHWAEQLSQKYLVFHAAALERQGKGLMLLGGPAAGKSTLALALVRSGFGYLSDEFAVVSPEAAEVLPFPNAICIKDPRFTKFAAPDPDFEVIPHPVSFRPSYPGAVVGLPRGKIVPPPGKRFPLQAVILLRGEESPGCLAAVHWSCAFLPLFNASWGDLEKAFHRVSALVRKVDLWQLGRANLDTMVAAVHWALNGKGSRPTARSRTGKSFS
jgi:hypothetical protein